MSCKFPVMVDAGGPFPMTVNCPRPVAMMLSVIENDEVTEEPTNTVYCGAHARYMMDRYAERSATVMALPIKDAREEPADENFVNGDSNPRVTHPSLADV